MSRQLSGPAGQRPVDVGVDGGDRGAMLGDRGREQRGGCRLSGAAFRACDNDGWHPNPPFG